MNKSYRLLWTDITRTWLTATTGSADQAGASIKCPKGSAAGRTLISMS